MYAIMRQIHGVFLKNHSSISSPNQYLGRFDNPYEDWSLRINTFGFQYLSNENENFH